tara:strand:+ start:2758 stop:3033 length:276 start_codon:yes stop_codon:yes gene_type:complete
MKSKEACSKIVNDLRNQNFEFSYHALERMAERGLSAIDVVALIESSSLDRPIWNSKNESWNFTGYGFARDLFTIACVYENDGTLIVTVFWE